MEKDWTGFVVNIPAQHCLVITGKWKDDRPDMWWWKCRKCVEGSGVMSASELERLEIRGMVSEPDGDTEDENSKHPKEETYSYADMYGYWE